MSSGAWVRYRSAQSFLQATTRSSGQELSACPAGHGHWGEHGRAPLYRLHLTQACMEMWSCLNPEFVTLTQHLHRSVQIRNRLFFSEDSLFSCVLLQLIYVKSQAFLFPLCKATGKFYSWEMQTRLFKGCAQTNTDSSSSSNCFSAN